MDKNPLLPLLRRNSRNSIYITYDKGLLDLFQLVLSEAIRFVGAKRGSIFFLNEEGNLQSIVSLAHPDFADALAAISFSERKNILLKKGESVPGSPHLIAQESYIACFLGQEVFDLDLGIFILEGINHFENFSQNEFDLISVYTNNLTILLKDSFVTETRTEVYLRLATSILLMIDNSNNHLRNKRFEYLLKEIIRVSGLINSSMDLSKLLTAVMESVKSVFRTESCSILLVDKEKKDLYFHIVAGEKQEEISRVRVPIGQGIAGTIAITKKPMIINDAQNDPRVFKGVDKATSFVTRNILGAALVVNDEVIGVMEAINTIDRNNFNSTDIDLFLSFSDAAALAIQKTRLLENLERTNVELEKKVGELESLFELGQAVLESKDEIDLLIRSVQIISVELSCEKTSIGILNDSKDKLTVISIIDDAEKITNIHLVQNSMVAESMTGNQIISVNDFKDIKRNGIDDVYLGDSFIIFPLAQANKNPFGAIIVSRKTSDGGFGESQVRFLQTISSQIIKGYENFKLNRGMIEKRAIEKEIEITRNIQNNILPSIQLSKSNYDLGIKTVPAKEVSGDFYDYFQYSDGQFSFLIADVSGKSLPAAIFMAMSSSIIRTLARNQNLMPDEILRQANDLIYEDSQSGMFVTLFFVQYNPALLEINYGSAGHNDQIWIKKDGSYSLIRGSGAPLGVMPKGRYTGGKFNVEPGDILVLYTDGAIEEKNSSDEEFGLERFVEEIIKRRDKSAKVIVEELYSLIKDFADGSEQFDDFTVLLMKFNDDYQFTKTFYAENREIPKFRDFVFDTIRVKELDEFLMDDILLSCDEAATNIVMHSYKDSNAISPTFDCSINFTSTGIQILISDRGSVFDRSLVKNPSVDANMKGERKGGFGVFLMEKLMDKVTYSWKDGINYVLLEKEFTLSIDA